MKKNIVWSLLRLATLSLLLLGVLKPTAAETYAMGPEFVDALREAGWDVERPADGSLILRLPRKGASEPRREVAAQEDAMWDRLRASGWRVEQEADGSKLLFPPEQRGSVGGDMDVTAPSGGPAHTAPGPSLEDLLRQRNWRVERAADGSLLLYPQQGEPEEQSRESAVPEPAPGVVLAPVSDEEIELPVDQWSEAKRLAEAWVGVFGGGELTVGKIRKVLRVYLVSVVEANPPFRLRHQLAIDIADGRVILLN